MANGVPFELDFQTRAFRFACDIVTLVRTIERNVPREIASQILRSGTSIGANLEEGKAAQSRRDLTAKFSIALKEAREIHYWLRLVSTTHPDHAQTVAGALAEANELIAILTAALRRLRGKAQNPEPSS